MGGAMAQPTAYPANTMQGTGYNAAMGSQMPVANTAVQWGALGLQQVGVSGWFLIGWL